jgi:hypothetical protein
MALLSGVEVSGRDLRVNRSRSAIVVAAVALVPLVGACSGEPKPKFAPSESSSPTTSERPATRGPVEPSMPAAATRNSANGAESFVRYWIRIVNFAQATGRAKTFKSLNQKRCVVCRGVLSAIEDPYSHGGRIEGGNWVVGRLRELPLDYGADWAAFATARARPQTIYDGKGGRKRYAGGPFHFYAYVAWEDGEWRMRWLRTPY